MAPVAASQFGINRTNLLTRILTLPSPFPSLTSIFIANVPVIVFFLALLGYFIDYISSRFSGGLARSNEIEVFDFIVIGGGSAGAIVANRLSVQYKVLLLEAGGNPHPFSYFPTASLVTLNLPLIDWGYKTVPQENACFALKNRISQWPRGKALGGSSIQNIMMYMRGNPRDYDTWAELTGDSGWNYENVLPFFKKLEDFHGHEYPDSVKYHGRDGPMHVEKLRFSPSLNYWLEAGKELGYNIVDANGFQTIGLCRFPMKNKELELAEGIQFQNQFPFGSSILQGFGGMDVSMKYGHRHSTYSGYLKPILNNRRSNLKIYRYAYATKIHLDKANKTAYGVTYNRHGVTKFVKATKEIILSAGAVNSPQLLMLSGIGPKWHLSQFGIETLIDLPVGENLRDHIFSTIGPFLINQTESFILDRDVNLKTFVDYFTNGSGPIASISGIAGYALLPSSLSDGSYPDIYINFVGSGVHKSLGMDQDHIFGFVPGTVERFLKPHQGKDAFFAAVNLAPTKSVGNIRLRSSNPNDYPLIDPKYLSHPHDVQLMVEGVKAAINILENTQVFKKLGTKLASNKFPTCQEYDFGSDEYFECFVRSYTLTVYHPCGTCRMGKGIEDPSAVVDSQLRVLHTSNLRVIDASIMPTITNTNLNAPCLMIGEKGADMILQYWEQKELEQGAPKVAQISKKNATGSNNKNNPTQDNFLAKTAAKFNRTDDETIQPVIEKLAVEHETDEIPHPDITTVMSVITEEDDSTSLPVYDIDPRR